MDREKQKLLLSLGVSVLVRGPGMIGVLWFLPLLRFSLGTDGYAKLLTAMALGSAAGFLAGGFNYVGRRMIGQAYAERDRVHEADGFCSLVMAQLSALVAVVTIIVGYCWLRSAGSEFMAIAILTAMIPSFGHADDVRAAYNELYVSACLMIVLQSIAYSVGFLLIDVRHSILLGALVIVGPYLLSSLLSLMLLLHKRPYLVSGQIHGTWNVIRHGAMLAMADGFVMATLSLSVVWLAASSVSETSSWYATIVRLFQIFLMPVILLLFPLSSYVRLLWHRQPVGRQQMFTRLTLVMGFGYGFLVVMALFVVSRIYVEQWMRLPPPASMLIIAPIFLLFGTIIAYKTYSQVAFLVLDETMHLSSWTSIAIGSGVLIGSLTSLALKPIEVISVYALVAGVATIGILVWNANRSIRLIQS